MHMNRPPLPALTGARFFAALAVFLFHYSDGFSGALRAVIEYGYVGVSFFFLGVKHLFHTFVLGVFEF